MRRGGGEEGCIRGRGQQGRRKKEETQRWRLWSWEPSTGKRPPTPLNSASLIDGRQRLRPTSPPRGPCCCLPPRPMSSISQRRASVVSIPGAQETAGLCYAQARLVLGLRLPSASLCPRTLLHDHPAETSCATPARTSCHIRSSSAPSLYIDRASPVQPQPLDLCRTPPDGSSSRALSSAPVPCKTFHRSVLFAAFLQLASGVLNTTVLGLHVARWSTVPRELEREHCGP